jgi:hypothetical protein
VEEIWDESLSSPGSKCGQRANGRDQVAIALKWKYSCKESPVSEESRKGNWCKQRLSLYWDIHQQTKIEDTKIETGSARNSPAYGTNQRTPPNARDAGNTAFLLRATPATAHFHQPRRITAGNLQRLPVCDKCRNSPRHQPRPPDNAFASHRNPPPKRPIWPEPPRKFAARPCRMKRWE